MAGSVSPTVKTRQSGPVHRSGEPAIRVEVHPACDDEHTPGTVGPASWLNPDGLPLRAAARHLHELQALQLAAIARATLSNSLRHAEARRIRVRLAAEGPDVGLEIGDDGRGFDPLRAGEGLGLTTMRQRAERLSARWEIESAPGRGTTVRVRLAAGPPGSPPPLGTVDPGCPVFRTPA